MIGKRVILKETGDIFWVYEVNEETGEIGIRAEGIALTVYEEDIDIL